MKNYFCEFVRAVRAGQSQAMLGRLWGVDQTTIGILERGESRPNYELLQRLAVEHGYNPIRMLMGNGPLLLKDLHQPGVNVPGPLMQVMELLVKYPGTVADIVRIVEATEELQQAKEKLNLTKKYPKPKG